MSTPKRDDKPAKKMGRYTVEHDEILLRVLGTYDPANSHITMTSLLEECAKLIPGRTIKGLRDRYARLSGERNPDLPPLRNRNLEPGPAEGYRNPIAKDDDPDPRDMIPVKPQSPSNHPAIREESFIKPPSKAQLMSRTGRLIRH
jgi:hypothetical protein